MPVEHMLTYSFSKFELHHNDEANFTYLLSCEGNPEPSIEKDTLHILRQLFNLCIVNDQEDVFYRYSLLNCSELITTVYIYRLLIPLTFFVGGNDRYLTVIP